MTVLPTEPGPDSFYALHAVVLKIADKRVYAMWLMKERSALLKKLTVFKAQLPKIAKHYNMQFSDNARRRCCKFPHEQQAVWEGNFAEYMSSESAFPGASSILYRTEVSDEVATAVQATFRARDALETARHEARHAENLASEARKKARIEARTANPY